MHYILLYIYNVITMKGGVGVGSEDIKTIIPETIPTLNIMEL